MATITRADGCYVPVELIRKEELEARLHKTFYFNRGNCKECAKYEVSPAECDGCQNFGGDYVLYDRVNNGKHWRIPRDTFHRLDEYFGIDVSKHKIVDKRVKPAMLQDLWRFTPGALYEYQRECLRKLTAWREYGMRGCLNAAPRTGKTVMSIALACAMRTRTVIIANQNDLLSNFRTDAEDLSNLLEVEEILGRQIMGIPKTAKDWETFDVVLLTSSRFVSDGGWKELQRYKKSFGLIVLDEGHRAAAPCFSQVMDAWFALHVIYLTATWKRKDGKHAVNKEVLGPIVAKSTAKSLTPRVVVHYLKDSKGRNTQNYVQFQKALNNDGKRTTFIVNSIVDDVNAGAKVVVPVLYLAHLAQLYARLTKKGLRVGVFVGKGRTHPALVGVERNRKIVIERAKAGEYDVVLGIRSIIGTGINVPCWTSMWCICPTGNEYNMYQETKRVCTPMEGKGEPTIHYVLENNRKCKEYLGQINREVFEEQEYTVDEATAEKIREWEIEAARPSYGDEESSFAFGFGGESEYADEDENTRRQKAVEDAGNKADFVPVSARSSFAF